MVYKHKMQNGNFKSFKNKNAYESWRRGMFARMEHGGKVRFVSREAQAKAKIQYRKKAFSTERDTTGRSHVVSGRVKAHGSTVKVEKKAGKDKATGYRSQSTSTDNFIVAETEEAGKYTPLNTELSIEEVDDDIIITRTAKSDGRVISSTVIKAAEPESFHNFFMDLEDRFSDDEDLKLWELRALADHFNVRSGGLTVNQLEGRLKKHTQGSLEPKFYSDPKQSSDRHSESEGMSEEERRDQAEAEGGFDVPPVDSTPITETPFSFERGQQQKAALPTPQARADLSPLQQADVEESIMELSVKDEGTAIDVSEGDKPLTAAKVGSTDPFTAALASEPLIQPKKPRSRSKLSKSFAFIREPNQSDSERESTKDIFKEGEEESFLHDADANIYNFKKDSSGRVKLRSVISNSRQNISGNVDKEDVLETLNISSDFDIDYVDTRD